MQYISLQVNEIVSLIGLYRKVIMQYISLQDISPKDLKTKRLITLKPKKI